MNAFFRVIVRALQAHALAGTGASDKFISVVLAKQLGVNIHQYMKSFSNSRCRWKHMFLFSICSSSNAHRYVFCAHGLHGLESGIPLVSGRPFFLQFKPQPLWKLRQCGEYTAFLVYRHGGLRGVLPRRRCFRHSLIQKPTKHRVGLRTNPGVWLKSPQQRYHPLCQQGTAQRHSTAQHPLRP